MVGVNTMRFVKRVDSECWTWMRRVARRMEDSDRRASVESMVSDDSSEALICRFELVVIDDIGDRSTLHDSMEFEHCEGQ